MRLRSLLFVPGDRPDRMEKALSSGADALILDLEDSVLPPNKPAARQAVAGFLARPREVRVFVRVNALGAETDADLAAIVPHGPDGIVLPKAEGAASLVDLDRRLTALGDKRARILPIASETPKAIFALGGYGGVTPRLCGLSWGAASPINWFSRGSITSRSVVFALACSRRSCTGCARWATTSRLPLVYSNFSFAAATTALSERAPCAVWSNDTCKPSPR